MENQVAVVYEVVISILFFAFLFLLARFLDTKTGSAKKNSPVVTSTEKSTQTTPSVSSQGISVLKNQCREEFDEAFTYLFFKTRPQTYERSAASDKISALEQKWEIILGKDSVREISQGVRNCFF